MQETEETFFGFAFFGEDAFALVMAEHAKEERLATLPAHHANTTAAHDFATMRTFERGHQILMARTDHGAIFQPYGRLGNGNFALNFRDGDGDFGGFNEQFHIAKPDRLAGFQPDLGHGLAVDEGAVGGIKIVQHDAIIGQNQFAMMD